MCWDAGCVHSWRWQQAYVRCFPLLAMAVSLMVASDPQSHTASVSSDQPSKDSNGAKPPHLLPTPQARPAYQL